MKQYLNKTLALALVLLFVLTGCGPAETTTPPAAVAIVIANHSCGCAPNLANPVLFEKITEAVESEGFVSVINADGDPKIIAMLNFELDDRYRNADPMRLAQDAKNKVRSLLYELTQVRAESPELDTLQALSLAAQSLGNAPEGATKTILVLDSGLSTTGLLSFGNNLLFADPVVIADMLAEREAIPDMSGVDVLWGQLGAVAAPQADLTPRQRNRLEDIWRTLVERGGATFTPITAVSNEDAAAELPAVSVLELPQDAPLAFEATEDALSFREPVFLRESQVQFIGDSAAYLDEAQAEAVLKPIAEHLLAHADIRLLLIGTTAGDDNNEHRLRLSESRAETVRNTLVRMGVSAERLTTKGLGSGDPWHIYGVGTESALASQNRKVVLLDAASDAASRLPD
ncbi:MAG: OmpA family protein [Oscillospiraceae bacterium]|nr:OmpA family protein [Oscillospiraceae bacterium]